jgi:endonuclease/exonuclease/phosphatase (EEP) superfamily protein YafD
MQQPRSRITRSGLLTAAGTLAGFATVVGFAGQWWWVFDLASHFRVQYALALSLGSLVMLAWRQPRWAAVFAGFALINAALLAPRFLISAETIAGTDGPAFRALLANVHASNRDYERIHQVIAEANPDVIVLLEVTPWLIGQLADLADRYPHRIAEPREDNFGIALFSRLPLRNAAVITLGPAGLPSLQAEVEADGRWFTLLGTHPPPPIGATMTEDRNAQLDDLARLARQTRQPLLALGDLNLSPWSPYFAQLLTDSGLRDSAAGRGLQPSWPAGWLPLWIPIDHGLYSDGIQIRHRAIGPDLGSDHYPVIVDFQVADL